MATCKGGARGSKELDKTCNLQTYYCYYYVILRYYAILCSARENNTVIKYIVYTNIRYWHISDNNRPWLSPAIIISTGRINWSYGRSLCCLGTELHWARSFSWHCLSLAGSVSLSVSGGMSESLLTMMDSEPFPACPRPLATLSEYSIKIPAPSHLGKYSHRILQTRLACSRPIWVILR